MTDVSEPGISLPGRLGVSARLEGGTLVLDLTPTAGTLHHGIVRASVLAFVIDVVAGIPLDQEREMWTLTTDMTVRMRPVPAPELISAMGTILRQGRRSATSQVDLVTEQGVPIASGAIGFARVPRRPGEPPKPTVPVGKTPQLFSNPPTLAGMLRQEAGIEVIDAEAGIVQVEVTPQLRNPAGTLQGAMVALVAESAAEDLMAARFGEAFVVTDLDLRYLRRTEAGPVVTRSRLLGTGPEASVEIELVDTSTDQITTLVYAAGVSVPAG